MSKVEKAVLAVVKALNWRPDLRSATKYLTPKMVVRVAARGRRLKYDNYEVVLKIGRPNHLERKFIKTLVKAGEPFPVKKVQLRYWPQKKAA